MPISRLAVAAGVVHPSGLELLGRVYAATTPENETSSEAENRASRILVHYQMGITDEAELKALAKQPLGR